MTDKLRDAAQQALEALEAMEKPQPTLAETMKMQAHAAKKLRTALAQQDAQAVPQGWRVERVSDDDVRVCGPDAETWLMCANAGKGTFEDFAYRFFFALASCPQPEAAPAVTQQDISELYAQGWLNGAQVQSLIDWCNSGSTKRADIAFTGGPSRQIAYAIEHLIKRVSNPETSEGVFVPRELLAKVANALGLPYEEEHTSLRSKLLDILSFAAPAQRVTLTDEETK